ncbi:MAG: BNR-4 repeat-containing protein [Bacteroidales bacterium]|jgi:hypothetical protein|nr:BNR-4 repeat-containing protein [Bacteroidales bacterium]
MINKRFALLFLISCVFFCLQEAEGQNKRAEGYRGIWFTLGQNTEYGDKYSGGLGTYTADHIPVAIYAPEAKKTFFVYGGTTEASERHLLIMISCYDHLTGKVPRPVIVYEKKGIDDPHDNASLSIDEDGYIWVFVSGRGRTRPGLIFRSRTPYSIDSFEKMHEGEMTYPQPWLISGQGFLFLFTRYTDGRELYWSVSSDGKSWSDSRKLAGFGGHYQVSNLKGKKVVTAFNYHPGGNVDKRTNLYFIQTSDNGRTWQTVQGNTIDIPLRDRMNDALVKDYESEGKLVYINDINFDSSGNPVILVILSRDFRPGPSGDPREWCVIRWKGDKWIFSNVCESTHNYDMGSLYTGGKVWRIIGPTDPGPQKYGTGGEVVVWESRDEGLTWRRAKRVTSGSVRNNSYVRRPVNANKDFYAFWADGDADKLSESRLYFINKRGGRLYQLPYKMDSEFEKPFRVKIHR